MADKLAVLPCPELRGGFAYIVHKYEDGRAMCRAFGLPDLNITYIGNPKWKEIADMLASTPCQSPSR